MATRRTNKKKSIGSQAIVVFWLVFIIVIICVFMLNAETIQKNFSIFMARLTAPSGAGAEEELLLDDDEPIITVIIEDRPSPRPAPAPTQTQTQTTEPAASAQPSAPERPTQTQPQAPAQTTIQPQTPTPAQTRDRAVYFTQVNSDGQILHSRVTRRVPVSESPMQDALNVLLLGPSVDEIARGILNLIPQNTRVLSAAVRGNTAYINFNEDFLFNTYGVEGYVAQLRQIVWTVTEFQNVRDVQILIEGRRMDYLGDGIWIGSPISRQSF